MNRKELEQILKEELEEGFFSNMAAKLRGAKDGGWEAVAAQGDGEDASSKMAGAPSDAKIPVKELIGKLATAGLPPDVSQQLFDEIVKQLKDIHGYGDAAIKEQAGALKGVAAQQSARTTSNMPSRKKTLDLDAVKIPKNMRKQVEQVLNDFFSKHGFTSVSLGQGADHQPPSKAAVEPKPETEKEKPVDAALPISASEIAILQGILRGGITRIISKSLADLGAAATQEGDAEILKALKRNILPKVNSLYKRANIDLAESLDYLDEKGSPSNTMSKQTQRAKKGQMRSKLGLKSALVKIGKKEPRLKRLIKKNFEQSLKNIENITVVKGAINKEFKRRLKSAGGNEKKTKEINKIFNNQIKFLAKNPDKRQEQLKQNAQVLVAAVMKIIDAGIKDTLAQFSKDKKALPEQIDESFSRMKVLSGINKKEI
tara:strand:+ start:44 stop:1330 length:1287 start_codon:yes stop_codon:yes gene_type:complete